MQSALYKLKQKYDNMPAPARASLWYVFCNVLNKGISLLTTPIFTRLMTTEQMGIFFNFQAWYNILIIFTSMNIFLGGFQKGMITWKNDVDRFSSSCLSLVVTITCGFGLLYLVAPGFWDSILKLPPVLMIPMFLELLTMPAIDFWANRQRFEYKYRKFVLVSIGMNLCVMVFGVWAVMNTPMKLEARVYTDVFSKMLFAVPLMFMIFAKGKTFFNKTWWTYSLNFNLPLIPHYLSNYVLNQSDRLMITELVSSSATALYSVAYQISMMMTLVTTAVNNSLTPYIYHKLEEKDVPAIQKSCRPLVWMVAALSIAAMMFAPEIIWIIGGEKYAQAIYVIPPVSASVFFIFIYNLYSNVEYYYEKTKLITTATMVAAALNLLLNWFFIQMFSFYAAGYTTLVSYILLSYLHYIFYKKCVQEFLPGYSQVFDLRNILSASALVLVIMVVMALVYPFPWIRYGLLLVAALVLFVKRDQVIPVVKKIIHKEI